MSERLSEWAKRKGIHPKTAYKMYIDGRMPVPTERLSQRVILVHDPEVSRSKGNVIYAKGATQAEIDSQVFRLSYYLTSRNEAVDRVITELGGVTDPPKRLEHLLSDEDFSQVVVDRLEAVGLTPSSLMLVNAALKSARLTVREG